MNVLSAVDALQSRGMLNSAGLDGKGGVIPGQEDQAMKSSVAQMALKSQVREMFRANPQLTLPEAQQALGGMIRSQVSNTGAQSFGPSAISLPSQPPVTQPNLKGNNS